MYNSIFIILIVFHSVVAVCVTAGVPCHVVFISRGCFPLSCFMHFLCPFMLSILPYGRKFWRGIYFGGLANISSAKTLQCAVIIICNHTFRVYNRPATGRASVIIGMEFTIDSCVRGYHVSKGFWTPEVGEKLAC